jgi:hypothetical protein
MKKVLVLAGLGLLALSFACGGGEKVENKETAAAMSESILSTLINNDMIYTGSVSGIINETDIGPEDCPLYGTISGKQGETDLKVTFNKCGVGVYGCPGHLFMSGEITQTWELDDSSLKAKFEGEISFIDDPENRGIVVYFVGDTCKIDVSAEWAGDLNEDEVEGEFCGYDVKDLENLTEEEICDALEKGLEEA